jgi:hypothetical protein
MKMNLLILAILSAYCQLGIAQSQTKTANLFNWNGNPYLNNWAQEGANYVSTDDNSFAYSKKLTAGRSFLSLVLQDFQFNIPSNATIISINVVTRRFKEGKGSITDYFANLVMAGPGFYNPTQYGVRWSYPTNYPASEGVVQYFQNGNGSNGGLYANKPYQWTPSIINNPAFGVRIDTYAPVGGAVVVYYDQVQITVQYSLPTTALKSYVPEETKILKEPSIYPNPFTTKVNIQFMAAETGIAVVELYTILGEKIQTSFSRNVVQGHVYKVVTGEIQLPKGVYVYLIRNGKYKYTGRLIKLD